MMIKFINTLKRTYAVLKFELLSYCCSFYGAFKAKLFIDKKNINKLEIGSSSQKKSGFMSSDISFSTDYPYDLRLGLPFPDASIDFIYAEHVLEHFEYKDLINLIKDCYRVLKPNGVLSVVVPDAAIYLGAYCDPVSFDYNKYCSYEFGLTYRTKIDYVNYIFYMGGHHRYMFDRNNLLAVLSEGGFRQISMRNFDPVLDQAARQHESIYAEGVK
ncbi:MAG: methyltransferase domain-containing protein [Nitrospirae bacterium]|nr:methyltransferase domain-containing protein [Nitrospirota bacterium]